MFNWLYARHTGGTFVLRIEDTDAARNTQEAVEVILDGLRWLGLDWDEGPISGDATGPVPMPRVVSLAVLPLAVLPVTLALARGVPLAVRAGVSPAARAPGP